MGGDGAAGGGGGGEEKDEAGSWKLVISTRNPA